MRPAAVPGFFGSDGERIFGCTHPADGAAVGVVICPSLYAEALSNYRAEVELARRLARDGIAVQRFHYRGSGHSDEAPEGATFETMLDDTLAAADYLREECGVKNIGFVAARWGAFVAAAASAKEGAAPVALWEPATDGGRYFREVNRFRLVHEMQKGIPSNKETLETALERDGWFDILGYRLERRFFDTAKDLKLLDLLGDRGGRALLVQLANKRDLRPELEKVRTALSDRDWEVSTATFQETPVWWLLRPPITTLGRLVNETAAWLRSSLEVEPS